MLQRLIDLILALFRTGRTVAPPGSEIPTSLRPRVLLITFNPIIRTEGERRLTEVLGWYDVDELCRSYIADLKECSSNFLEYQIVEQILVDDWPVKVDGFRYDETSFLHCWRSQTGWHQPDAVDYKVIVSRFDLLTRVESGQIDEVWIFAFPFAGLYESLMVGPDAFWCNSPPLLYDHGISRRFIIMGFNYERDVGPMLESFGHRVESHLQHAWRRYAGEENLWEQFIRYDKIAPGRANCGWMHYAPNSLTDYDWGNRNRVLSNCDDWLNFPNFQGIVREVDCSEWGGGDMRAHHKWWLRHLPRAPGYTQGIANHWWWIGIDPNAVS
ncbi:MAG: hypothetical protein ACUVWZ_02505 [Anaerolineae bacterium]